MEDILPTLIIIGAIYLLVRWLTGSKSNDGTAEGVIRGVTPSMVDTVHSAFPDIPVPNVIYHLSRSRSAQSTSEEILERGFLPAPPPNFVIPASLLASSAAPVTPAANSASASASASSNTKSPSTPKPTSLIERYNLSSRLSSHNPSSSPSPVTISGTPVSEKGKGKEVADPLEAALSPTLGEGTSPNIGHASTTTASGLSGSRSGTPDVGGSAPGTPDKAAWEATREKRELGLKERKEKMILEARRRMLEKQAKEAATA